LFQYVVEEQPERLLVGVDETMRQLGISRSTVTRLCARRELVPVKIGTRTCITQESIRAFVDRRIAEARAKAEMLKPPVPISTPTTVDPFPTRKR
jgi:excisionase family DNA binding protein